MRLDPGHVGVTEPVNPSNPSVAPDPFENSVRPCSSYTQISDPRWIALPIAIIA
jgi:hypothetical protein